MRITPVGDGHVDGENAIVSVNQFGECSMPSLYLINEQSN